MQIFKDQNDVVVTLKQLEHFVLPNTSSLIVLAESRNNYVYDKEPFKKGFLNDVEKRQELATRLKKLDKRKAKLLIMWHIESRPKAEIAATLGLSRTHVYRLYQESINDILQMDKKAA